MRLRHLSEVADVFLIGSIAICTIGTIEHCGRSRYRGGQIRFRIISGTCFCKKGDAYERETC